MWQRLIGSCGNIKKRKKKKEKKKKGQNHLSLPGSGTSILPSVKPPQQQPNWRPKSAK